MPTSLDYLRGEAAIRKEHKNSCDRRFLDIERIILKQRDKIKASI